MDAQHFENQVRTIARALWPQAEFQGAIMALGRERDGVFITDEMVNLVEATVSRTLKKAEDDTKKLAKLATELRKTHWDKGIKGWFVTLEEPTAEQRGAVNKLGNGLVVAISFDQFRQKLIDATTYIEARKNYAFGSMNQNEKDNFHFIEMDISSNTDRNYSIDTIEQELRAGHKFTILGDYGSGKSTSTRELFLRLRKRFLKNETFQFPVLLNLRDHYGQEDYDEALERHARRIGFNKPSDLVRAFNAGYVILLLDGFDELATPGWSGQASKLHQLRHKSMQLIRDFVQSIPQKSGLVISGRTNYFNSGTEMQKSLGLPTETVILRLNDFNDRQIEEYLKKKGLADDIPLWLPSRPLLLGHLVAWGLFNQITKLGDISPAQGWDMLLEKICAREASQTRGSLEAETVRLLIERLSSYTRRNMDSLGVLHPDDILTAFREVGGFSADDNAAVLLQRLPGLSEPNAEDGSRQFIDESLVDVAKAGDIVRYVSDPYSFDADTSGWTTTFGHLGCQVAANKCTELNLKKGNFRTAIQHVNQNSTLNPGLNVVAADMLDILSQLDESYDGTSIYVTGVMFPHYICGGNSDFSSVEFQDCIFEQIDIMPDAPLELLPRFVRCHFGVVDGRLSEQDLPKERFIDCAYEEFAQGAETNNAILALDIPMGQRVLFVTLKKLYLQRGAGRMESALYRGLDQKGQRLVTDILRVLEQENLVMKSKGNGGVIWLPVRSQSARVNQLLSMPSGSKDIILRKLENLV